MGFGNTTVGKILAQLLNYSFIDRFVPLFCILFLGKTLDWMSSILKPKTFHNKHKLPHLFHLIRQVTVAVSSCSFLGCLGVTKSYMKYNGKFSFYSFPKESPSLDALTLKFETLMQGNLREKICHVQNFKDRPICVFSSHYPITAQTLSQLIASISYQKDVNQHIVLCVKSFLYCVHFSLLK